MKRHGIKRIGIMILPVVAFFCWNSIVNAESLEQSGSVNVVGSTTSPLVDPENPEAGIDPGEGPSTQGSLRIDYVSSLNFGRAAIKAKGRIYPALAQQFLGETGPRGSYIQLTDQRAKSTGWTLQVKQNRQFQNPQKNEIELKGAMLSLDKAWANSSSLSKPPTVTRETIGLDLIDTAYEVAVASPQSGRGVWTIAFGASPTNVDQQENTLTPVLDNTGKAVVDGVYHKPAYSNSAITLSLPDATEIYPVDYVTELTWILSELP